MEATPQKTRLRSANFRAFALREHYLYFKILAYGVSPWLCVVLNRLGVSPNQVTLAGIALVIPSVLLNLSGHMWMAIVLFHLFFVFDAVDGILARATGKKSKLGAYLDDMAHHMFHVPFLLSMAYAYYRDSHLALAGLIAFFSVANTLYRAQLDVLEKTGLFEARPVSVASMAVAPGLASRSRDLILGSFNFPNVLVWMTALMWSRRLMVLYFVYAFIMTVLYYLYLFVRTVRRCC